MGSANLRLVTDAGDEETRLAEERAWLNARFQVFCDELCVPCARGAPKLGDWGLIFDAQRNGYVVVRYGAGATPDRLVPYLRPLGDIAIPAAQMDQALALAIYAIDAALRARGIPVTPPA